MAIKYIPYYPDTIEGQALLDNFVRTRRVLKYRDNDKIVERVMRGMPLYEMELVETVGKKPDGNLLIRGECLSACAYLKDKGIEVDLVYIDPPFASGADYAKKVYIRRNPKIAAAIAKAEEEMDDDELRAFEDKMYGDVWDKEKYLNWMFENLMAIKSVMSPTASIYVHLDWHIGHYVKVLLDEIFGENNFRNEIVWKRRGGALNNFKAYGSLTDTIFFYTHSDDYVFNSIKIKDSPDAQDYIKERFIYNDGDGRLYSRDPITNPSSTPTPSLIYEYKGYKPPAKGWAFSVDTMKEWDAQGKLYFPADKKQRIRRKTFLDEYEGQPIQNLWTDIYVINSQAKESIGYETQKPEALLNRIISASSNKGMIVADFFGGSGVTAAVSCNLGRKYIHCDVGINSIQAARDRLVEAKATFEVLEIRDGVSLYRNPVQTMEKLKSLISGLRNEDALDKFWEGAIQTTSEGMVPVYVPNLMDSGTRLLDKVLMNRIIREAMPDLPTGTKKVIVYYIDIEKKEDIEKFIRDYNDTGIAIELRDLKVVLGEVVTDDQAEYSCSKDRDGLLEVWKVEIDRFLSDRVRGRIDAYNQKGKAGALVKEKADDEESDEKPKKKFKPIRISEDGLELVEALSLDCTSDKGLWHSDSEVKIDKLGYVIRNGVKTKEFWDGAITSEKQPKRLKIRNICGDETIFAIDQNASQTAAPKKGKKLARKKSK